MSLAVKGTIREMQLLAKSRGGRCWSKTYTNSNNYLNDYNSKTKLWWECNQGHRFEATPESIRKGGWCKKCK